MKFFDFLFLTYGRLMGQNVFPHLNVRVPSASNSPSAHSAQAGRALSKFLSDSGLPVPINGSGCHSLSYLLLKMKIYLSSDDSCDSQRKVDL